MKTVEDYLAAVQRISKKLHRFSEFSIMKEIQPKTIALKCNLTIHQQDEFCHEIRKDLNIWAESRGDHLTLYPELRTDIMDILINIITSIKNSERIRDKIWITAKEQENLADKKIVINIFFPKIISSANHRYLIEEFQIKTGIGAQWLSDENLLIDFSQKVNPKELIAKREKTQKEAERKKIYAQECGKLSRLYNVPFANVLLLGPNPEIIQMHASQLRRASGLIAAQDAPEKRILYKQLFSKNRSETRKALQDLGISIGDIDPLRIELSMLKKAFN